VRHDTADKVLVLGSDTRSFLAVIRSLGRRHLRVHVASCPPGAPALRSRYIARVHHLPPYSANAPAWRDALASLLERERFALVIPCDDPTLWPLQLHADELRPLARLAVLSEEAFAVTTSKRATTALARRFGVPVPQECIAFSTAETDAIVAQLGLPVVLKPDSSFGLEDLTTRRDVRTAYTRSELLALLNELLPDGPVQAQEYFRGRGVGVEILAYEGCILYAFQHQRVHEPPEGGGSSYRKSVPLSPELVDAVARLMQALHYTGVAMVEFRVDTQTGAWILVEINGRFWGSLPLAVAAGADFPYYLYELLVRGRRDFAPGYREGLFARNWLKDVTWVWQHLHATPAAPSPPIRPFRRLATELMNVVTLRERSDTLVLDDPRPALTEIGMVLRKRIPWALRAVPKLWRAPERSALHRPST